MTEVPETQNSDDSAISFVAGRLNGELSRDDYPREFTERAVAALFRAQSNFVADVGVEAIRLARLARADTVSEVNIDAATARLRGASDSASQGWLLGVGAGLAGVGVSVLITLLTAVENPTALWWFAAILPLLVGTAMLSYTAPRR